jgi:hypothetical protein
VLHCEPARGARAADTERRPRSWALATVRCRSAVNKKWTATEVNGPFPFSYQTPFKVVIEPRCVRAALSTHAPCGPSSLGAGPKPSARSFRVTVNGRRVASFPNEQPDVMIRQIVLDKRDSNVVLDKFEVRARACCAGDGDGNEA